MQISLKKRGAAAHKRLLPFYVYAEQHLKNIPDEFVLFEFAFCLSHFIRLLTTWVFFQRLFSLLFH
ncbi:MAG: hypothetical protein CR997_08710 [Acidobacteria bacterium]|nr:MAG: hypothetical protein CR997_08710 [Acidobacteriota bacterium]